VRGQELLADCDAVVIDALANPSLVARARANGVEPSVYDVGKRGGASDSTRQEEINALLVRLAREGKRVVRLKGGDPFVFGRGGEEALALAAARCAFEVVPGVTAGVAAPAYAGIPVTHRGLAASVTFVTGHEDPSKEDEQVDWSALARAGGTIVLYMGVRALPRIVACLRDGGLAGDTPAAAIRWGTHPRQQTVEATLATLVDAITSARLMAPVITVIGRVVELRDQIAWFEARPLFGRRILVTRARAQASTLSRRLTAEGADVVETPAIRIEPLDQAPLRDTLSRLSTYGWAIFTSQNAVAWFWEGLRSIPLDARALAGIQLAAIGPATSGALLERGLAVDVVPQRFVAEGLLDVLRQRDDVRGARVLYATAEGARDVLPAGLREMGARVDVVPLYRSVPSSDGASELRERLEHGEIDLVTLTSASSVDGYVAAVGAEAARLAPAASIGPITTDAARRAGLTVAIEAEVSTIDGLVDAIVRSRPTDRGARGD
jgi:uroporphyrinogen III methyltransferase/synthase